MWSSIGRAMQKDYMISGTIHWTFLQERKIKEALSEADRSESTNE